MRDLQNYPQSEVVVRYLDDDLVRGTSIVPLYNPTGKADRQRHLSVSLILRIRAADIQAVEANLQRLADTFVPLLRTKRIDAIAGADDLSSLAAWLIARLHNRGMGPARLERLELIDDSGPSFTLSPETGNGVHATGNGDLVTLLQSCELVGHFTATERYNTRADGDAIREILKNAAGASVPVVSFLCPPYVGQSKVGGGTRYVAVHDSFDDDPASYNFDYHYRLYVDCLSAVARLAKSHGVEIAPVVVFSDWALIGIDAIRATMGSDDRIVDTLAKFREGMVRHAGKLVPAVAVTSFQELGVANHLPLGLPSTGSSREVWLRAFMEASGSMPALAELLGYSGKPDRLCDLLDWRAFATVARSPHRSTVIDCLKVYHNICRLRFAALANEEQRRLGDIKSETASELRYEAYLDAILRLVQYQLYAKLAVEHFGRSICCYQDPGFTACGNLFRQPGFPVLFLDPTLVLAAAEATTKDTSVVASL
jgi:hypothetical protein